MGKLRVPDEGFCWRDARRKCWHGTKVAIFCFELTESISCPDVLAKFKAEATIIQGLIEELEQ